MKKKIVNVLEFGADPSGTSDCTAAFKEALETSGALGVIAPAGLYKLSGMIVGDPPSQPDQSIPSKRETDKAETEEV